MKQYIFFRLMYACLIIAFVSVLIFIMVRLLPGDPIRAAMQANIDLTDDAIVEQVREQYGLNKPVPIQYVLWVRDFLKGDWGQSLGTGDTVMNMFLNRFPVTLELFFGATLWSFAIGFPLGVLSALKRNTILDIVPTTIAIIGVSAPVFWTALLSIYLFAVYLDIFPPSGYVPFMKDPWGNIMSVFLPTLVMGFSSAGGLARYVRSSLLEVLGQDYIRTAWAKGLRHKAIVIKHAAKPALIPVVTIIGLSWGHMVGGSFLVEYMFAVPGIGRMAVDGIFSRDFPVIQAVVIVTAINVLIMNLIVDISYGYLDPRVRSHK